MSISFFIPKKIVPSCPLFCYLVSFVLPSFSLLLLFLSKVEVVFRSPSRKIKKKKKMRNCFQTQKKKKKITFHVSIKRENTPKNSSGVIDLGSSPKRAANSKKSFSAVSRD